MGKFTSSNLFNKNNKEHLPDWMGDLANNLEIKEKEKVEFEGEKRGVFAELQQVYRPEVTADPRNVINPYNETRLISESKISLARFLSNKYYKVVKANAGSTSITLNVKLDSVPADFIFPFEVSNGKISTGSSFYVNEGEYPFSKAGLSESLEDIKTGRIKQSSTAEAVGKAFLINREEIVRRYNGSLRAATDRINELLNEGVIIGAGSNTYASFHDVDHLFPQMEKQASEEKMAEFHFAPNQEHVEVNEYKTADYLSLTASKILSNYFDSFKIENTFRDSNELLVKASILNKGIKNTVDFSFAIENEKIRGIKIAELNDKRMTVDQLMETLAAVDNSLLNKYLANKQASKHIYTGVVLTLREINAKLGKVVEASKVDNVVKNWIYEGMISPINSTTFATNHTFEELIATANVDALSDEQIEAIKQAEKSFGEGLEVEIDLEKPMDEVREVEDKGNDESRLANATAFLSRHIKKYTITTSNKVNDDTLSLNIGFINSKTGTKHQIPFNISFDGSKVVECSANIGGKNVSIDRLLDSFAANKVLSLYLQDKTANLNDGPVIITKQNLKRKLSTVITASKIDEVINNWLQNGSLNNLNGEVLASQQSLENLITGVDPSNLITPEEQEVANYQKDHFGKEIKIKTDDKVEDTGVREPEEQEWGLEKKKAFAANEIGKMFKDYRLTASFDSNNGFIAVATVNNPISGGRTNLKFRFNESNGILKHIVAVSDPHDDEEVSIDKIVDLLEKQATEVTKHFTANNKVSERIYSQKLISKAHLANKLKTVAKAEYVSEIIDNLIKWKALKPINSATFSSLYTIAELVNIADGRGKTDLQAAKEQLELAAGRSNEQTISFSNKIEMAQDSRELKTTVRELTPQMIGARDSLISTVKKAKDLKKVTARKHDSFIESLNAAKTAQDLERVASEIRNYLK